MLRRILGPWKGEVSGKWMKPYNEELNDLYSSLNIVQMIKPRRMRWTVYVARMGKERRIEGFGGKT